MEVVVVVVGEVVGLSDVARGVGCMLGFPLGDSVVVVVGDSVGLSEVNREVGARVVVVVVVGAAVGLIEVKRGVVVLVDTGAPLLMYPVRE